METTPRARSHIDREQEPAVDRRIEIDERRANLLSAAAGNEDALDPAELLKLHHSLGAPLVVLRAHLR